MASCATCGKEKTNLMRSAYLYGTRLKHAAITPMPSHMLPQWPPIFLIALLPPAAYGVHHGQDVSYR
jgi:hypothetical protein